jgi:hypothetical protein
MGDKSSGLLSFDEIAGVVATPAEVRSGTTSGGRAAATGGYGFLADRGYGAARWLGQGAYNVAKTVYDTPLGGLFDNIMGGLSGKGAEAQAKEGAALFGAPSEEEQLAAQPSAQDEYLKRILAEAEERKRKAALARAPGARRAATGALTPEADDPAARFTLDQKALVDAENENLQPVPEATLPSEAKPPAEYGTLEEALQFKNPGEAQMGTALDIASSLAPNPVSRAEIVMALSRTAPKAARFLLTHPRLGNAAINAAREGVMGAGLGAFQEADPYTGAGYGTALGALLPPSLGSKPGGMVARTREAWAEGAERSAKQRAGQAFSPSTNPNKRFVERNWERMTREAPTWTNLERVQKQAQREADAAGQRLEAGFDLRRQTSQSATLRKTTGSLTRAANLLLKQGVELAPQTRENLETVVGALRGLNPRSTNLNTLQRAHEMVIDALHEVGRENARLNQLMMHTGVRQIFDQAAQQGVVPASRRAMVSGGLGLEDVALNVAPSRINTRPILRKLERAQQRHFMHKADNGRWIVDDPQGHGNLQTLIDQIAQNGDEVSLDTLREIRQTWDNIVKGGSGTGFLADNLADASKRGSIKIGRGVLAERMASKAPELVPHNRAFSYHQNVADVVAATPTRRTGQTKGPLAGIAATAGLGFGTRQGDDETSAGDALGSLTAGALAWYATRLVKSPNWNLLSAKIRLKVADALRRGNTSVLRHTLARAEGYLHRRAAGRTGPDFAEQDNDLSDDESDAQLQRILGGYALEPGVTAPQRDASEIPDPIEDGDEDDDNEAGVQPGIDTLDIGVPGVDPLVPGSRLTPDAHEAIEGEEAANAAQPGREEIKAELQRAGLSGRELRETLRSVVAAMEPVTRPLVDAPSIPGWPRTEKFAGALSQFTSPLDLLFAGTSAARPILGTATRAGRLVEGVGRLASGATALQGAETLTEGVEERDPFKVAAGGTGLTFGALGSRKGGAVPLVGRTARRVAEGLKAAGYETLVGPALALGAEALQHDPIFEQLVPDEQKRAQITQWLQLGAAPGISIAAVGGYPKRTKARFDAETKRVRDMNTRVRKAAETHLGEEGAKEWFKANKTITPELIAETPWLAQAAAASDVPGGATAWMAERGPLTKDAQIKSYINTLIREAYPDTATRMQHRYWAKELQGDYEGVNFDERKRMTDTYRVDKRSGKSTLTPFTKTRLEKAYEVGQREGAAWGDPAWIGKLVGNDPERAIQLVRMVGATSPGTKTHVNVMHGLELYLRHVLGDEPAKQIISSMRTAGVINAESKLKNIARAKAGQRLGGQKVETLSGNELGVKGDIPIDLWLLRAFGSEDEKSPEGRRYRDMERGFIDWSKSKGEDPFDVMAKVWVGMQQIEGARTPAFSAVGDQLAALGIRNIHHPAMQAYLHQPGVIEGLSARIFGKNITGKKAKGGGRLSEADLPPLPKPPDVPDDAGMLAPEAFAERVQALLLKTRIEGETPVQRRARLKAEAEKAEEAMETYDPLPIAATRSNDTGRRPTGREAREIARGRRLDNPIEAWHGSGADFDEFSSKYIGTGEGNQSYSRGLYFGGERETGEAYREALAKDDIGRVNVRGVDYDVRDRQERASLYHHLRSLGHEPAAIHHALDTVEAHSGDTEGAKSRLRWNFEPEGTPDETPAQEQLRLAAVEVLDVMAPKKTGALYNVKLHVDPKELLDWDAPLSKQPKAVRDLFSHRPATETLGRAYQYTKHDIPPKLATKLEKLAGQGDVPWSATGSELLTEAFKKIVGAPGLKYLDQRSRMGGDAVDILARYNGNRGEALAVAQTRLNQASDRHGRSYWQDVVTELSKPETHNYVIYRDDLIEIARKLGITLAAATALLARQGFEVRGQGEGASEDDAPR